MVFDARSYSFDLIWLSAWSRSAPASFSHGGRGGSLGAQPACKSRARQTTASKMVDAIDPACLEGIGLFSFFGRRFGARRLASGPKDFFPPFTPPAQFFLSLTHE